jgi:8-oxo-dGTP pyrophosphatase MutT (NUDIX family)
MLNILSDPARLRRHITAVSHERNKDERIFAGDVAGDKGASAVLLLLSQYCGATSSRTEPCLVFNKRSEKVRQPGDLCFPGGRITPHLDFWISKILELPFSPLYRWPHWREWRVLRQREAKGLSILLSAGLRESLEEMRLNPLGVQFLGFMPPQRLPMFGRVLYPMVGWITRQRHFFANWEVEKVIHVPVREFLNPEHYACYRLHFKTGRTGIDDGVEEDFPCFRHESNHEKEVLWGVTYEIVVSFLDIVFAFRPPETQSLPVVYGTKDERYLNGAVAG